MVNVKKSLFLILLLLTSSIAIFANENAARIGDTFYAGRLTSEKVNVRGLDKTVKIDFLVGSNGYNFEISKLSPTNIELRIQQTGQTISADLNKESQLDLADGSKLFVKFTEYERANSDIVLWAEPVGGEVETNVRNSNLDTDSENTAENQEAETMPEENNLESTNQTQPSSLFPKINFNLTWLWIALAVIVVLLVLFGSIWYFKKHPPKSE